MKIAIDIDDTISKTNEKILEEAIKYDKEKLKGRGFKDKDAYSFMEMFYWTVVDVDNFLANIRKGSFYLRLDPIPNAKEMINKLYEEGNEIYFVTRRSNSFGVRYKTKKWLKQQGINYNKIIFNSKKKDEICSSLGVDCFVDDDVHNVKAVSKLGIKSCVKATRYNNECEDLVRLDNWEDIYKYFKEV